jgi:hypothetical protein
MYDFLCFDVAILKIIGRDSRWGIDEFGASFGGNRFFWLALAFQAGINVLLCLLFGGICAFKSSISD